VCDFWCALGVRNSQNLARATAQISFELVVKRFLEYFFGFLSPIQSRWSLSLELHLLFKALDLRTGFVDTVHRFSKGLSPLKHKIKSRLMNIFIDYLALRFSAANFGPVLAA
jgi:hypothetical protein